MTEYRGEKVTDLLTRIAANYFQRESNNTSIITVTRVDVAEDLKHATIYITVLPVEMEQAALDFAKRKRSEIRADIKDNLRLHRIPFIDVMIDKGEKLRQRIDEITSGN